MTTEVKTFDALSDEQQRKSLDKFYTNTDIAQSIVKQYVKQRKYKNSMFIEPSAGDGSLMNVLNTLKIGSGVIGFDLLPERKDIIQHDFLTVDVFNHTESKDIITFMNPPFGKSASLAVKFFNKASSYSNEIWAIVPRTFKKHSIKNKLSLNMHMEYCVDLPKNSFIFAGNVYDVPCCFQVWTKSTKARDVINFTTSELFSFTTKVNADIAVRRVGGKSGQVLNGLDHSESSTYFIKVKNKQVINAMRKIDLSVVNNTVGVRSLSKAELIELTEKEYNNVV